MEAPHMIYKGASNESWDCIISRKYRCQDFEEDARGIGSEDPSFFDNMLVRQEQLGLEETHSHKKYLHYFFHT
jgi:hypothetical protein